MAEYCGSCDRACRRSKRLSRAKFDGVVIKIRGGRVCCPKAGLERSWKMSSIRVCVFPVCNQPSFSHIVCETYSWWTMYTSYRLSFQTECDSFLLTIVQSFPKPLDFIINSPFFCLFPFRGEGGGDFIMPLR